MRRRQRRFVPPAALAAALAAAGGAGAQQALLRGQDPAALVPAGTPLLLDGVALESAAARLGDGVAELRDRLGPMGRLLFGFAAAGLQRGLGEEPGELLARLGDGPVAVAWWPAEAGEAPFPVVIARPFDAPAFAAWLRGRGAAVDVGGDGLVRAAPGPRRLAAVRAFQAGDAPRLAADPQHGTLRPELPADGGVRLHVDLAQVRANDDGLAGAWRRLDPFGRLVVGPWVWPLTRADRVAGVLRVAPDTLRVELVTDASPADDEAATAPLLGGDGHAPVARPPVPADAILRLDLDRSPRGLFAELDRVLGEAGAANARASVAQLDALMFGDSIVDDVLGGLVEPWTLVVLETPERAAPMPLFRTPGAALVARLEREVAGEQLARLARGLVVVGNVQRKQRGQPAFETTIVEEEGLWMRVSELAPWTGKIAPPLEYNFAPTLALAHGHAVLATDPETARRCAAALTGPAREVAGDHLAVDLPRAGAWLDANREVLAVDRMLREGFTLDRATRDLRAVAALLGAMREASWAVEAGPETTRAALELHWSVR